MTRELRARAVGADGCRGPARSRSSTCPRRRRSRDDEGFVDWSYVNHLVVNGGVIACGFGEERADAAAREILADAYPGRRVGHRRRPADLRAGRRHPLHHPAAAEVASRSDAGCIGARRTERQSTLSRAVPSARAPRPQSRAARTTAAACSEPRASSRRGFRRELRSPPRAASDRRRTRPATSPGSTRTTPRHPTALNAVVVRNPDALAEAAASDARRAEARRSARSTASRTRRRTATSCAG